MGRPASSDYWRRWRAAHPGVPGAGAGARPGEATGRATARRRRRRARVDRRAGPGRGPSAAGLGAGRWPRTSSARTAGSASPTSSTPTSSARSSWRGSSGRTRSREPPPGCGRSAPGATTSRRCSRSAERWMARSRVCACRGCETHTGACGWPTTNERRCDRCGRPGFANRFRRTPDHPVRRTSRPGDGWRSGRSRTGWRATAGPARAGIERRTRCDPASSRPTIRCRSSSVASRCRRGLASSARAATRARG